jgi:DNA adenine methylase
MPVYTCERCLKEFSQKSHFNKHLERKNPCQNNKGKIEEVVEKMVNEKIDNTLNKKLNKKLIGDNENIIIQSPSSNKMCSTKFEEMKVSELKIYCKENGIKGISGLKKQDIITIINNKNISLSPIIKWSGGKNDEIKKFIDYIPKTYDTYLEPFIGGGAVYFHINPQKAVINDVHTELVDFYQSIKNGYSNKIYNFMKEHPNQEDIYYKVRSYKPSNQLENAQRFYYLRKTCFRGMLRYNSKGEFNIPYGRYKNYNFEDIKNKEYEKLLKNTEIFNKDFKYIFDNYNSKDNFMFLDPPYDSEFTDYGYCCFGKDEHKKLAKCFKETKIKCLMIIGKTKFISQLYDGYIVGQYDKNYRFKLHSGRVGDEINTKHLIIMNY